MAYLDIDLNDLYLFAQVIDRKGFTAASAMLDIPKSRLSRRIAELESRLGTRLLHRTSRKLSVTDAGQALYGHCIAMIHEARAGHEAVTERQSEPAGTVRMSVPVGIADIVLSRLLLRFTQKYPKITLNVQATNHHVDLVQEKIDLAIRDVGLATECHGMVQLPVCAAQWKFMASPDYLKRAGPINSLTALSGADTLLYEPLGCDEGVLRLTGPGPEKEGVDTPISIPFRLKLQSDNLALLRQMCLAGMGVASMPVYTCKAELDAGLLQVVMPGYRPKMGHVFILLPAGCGFAPAVRVLLDFLKIELPLLL